MNLLDFLKEHFHWSVADRLEAEFSDLRVRIQALEAKVGLGATEPQTPPQPTGGTPHEGT